MCAHPSGTPCFIALVMFNLYDSIPLQLLHTFFLSVNLRLVKLPSQFCVSIIDVYYDMFNLCAPSSGILFEPEVNYTTSCAV